MEGAVTSLYQDIGMDFYSWLMLLLIPEDKSMYAAVLRSPLVHISDAMVVLLLAVYDSIDEHTLFTFPNTLNAFDKSYANTRAHYKEDIQALEAIKEKYKEARVLLVQGNLMGLLEHFG